MKEFKGTKGEWKLIKNGVEGQFSPPRKKFLINAIRRSLINYVETIASITTKIDSEESESNAKLIAAAPDLLEALQEMLTNFPLSIPDNLNEIQQDEAIKKAEQAINKALGL
jgi:hypothetical protein